VFFQRQNLKVKMEKNVNETIDSSIEKLAGQVGATVDSTKALHFSQSALNLAQTKSLLACTPKSTGSSESKK
jgi:hypothetical protein